MKRITQVKIDRKIGTTFPTNIWQYMWDKNNLNLNISFIQKIRHATLKHCLYENTIARTPSCKNVALPRSDFTF